MKQAVPSRSPSPRKNGHLDNLGAIDSLIDQGADEARPQFKAGPRAEPAEIRTPKAEVRNPKAPCSPHPIHQQLERARYRGGPEGQVRLNQKRCSSEDAQEEADLS